ncbi:hypothetical protein BGX21_007869, partial [Mortierella sp. AD011]
MVLMQSGLSTHEAARRANISQSSASRIHSDNKENMPINRGGRPRKTTSDVIKHLKVNMERGIMKTAVEATKEANQILPRPVSAMTIRRRLRESGLIAKKIVKRPALRPEHIKGRMEF